jgi:hypothetical protein
MGLIGLTEGLEQPDQASEVSTTDETSSGDCTDRIQHHKERKKERDAWIYYRTHFHLQVMEFNAALCVC